MGLAIDLPVARGASRRLLMEAGAGATPTAAAAAGIVHAACCCCRCCCRCRLQGCLEAVGPRLGVAVDVDVVVVLVLVAAVDVVVADARWSSCAPLQSCLPDPAHPAAGAAVAPRKSSALPRCGASAPVVAAVVVVVVAGAAADASSSAAAAVAAALPR